MSTLGNTSRETVGSLLGWLGFRNEAAKGQSGPDPAAPHGAGSSLHEIAGESQSWLLDAISSFLLENDLEVSPANLLAAHSVFSGTNPRLAREIAAKAQSEEGISQSWLDEVARHESHKPDSDEIARLMARLEDQLESFSRSTVTARSATTSYNAELEQHVAELEEIEETGQILSSLVGLTKAMLERTRKIEDEMRRSEDEAKALRQNLARAKRDAEIDHLTGLPNRRAFETQLKKQYEEAQATLDHLCVGFCDVDNFKRINDTHGHDAGDRVIKVIAESLAAIVNNNCYVARHGGEEFVVLFRNMTPSEAHKCLDEVREHLADRRLINRKNDVPFGQITFSGGVADVFAYPDPEAAFRAADEALYIAKEGGRNQIVIAQP